MSQRNQTGSARNRPKRNPACSPAHTRLIQSIRKRFPSGSPTTYSPAMAPAQLWLYRATTRAILNLQKNSTCRSYRWSSRLIQIRSGEALLKMVLLLIHPIITFPLMAFALPKPKRKSPPGWKKKVSGKRPSITNSATGSSAASAIGASRSRSFGNATRVEIFITKHYLKAPCRFCHRSSMITSPHLTANPRLLAQKIGSTCPMVPRAKPTPCPNGPVVAGITSAISTPRIKTRS